MAWQEREAGALSLGEFCGNSTLPLSQSSVFWAIKNFRREASMSMSEEVRQLFR